MSRHKKILNGEASSMRSIRAEELCFKGSPEAFKIIDYTYKDKGYSEL